MDFPTTSLVRVAAALALCTSSWFAAAPLGAQQRPTSHTFVLGADTQMVRSRSAPGRGPAAMPDDSRRDWRRRLRFVLIGGAVGAAVGFLIGLDAQHSASSCTDCIPSTTSYPALGAMAGTIVGAATGLLVATMSDEHAAMRGPR